MAGSRSLEARYRRLLMWFPPEHRRAHADEMVGVLLSTADPGQERPGRAESLNLMLSGLRVRLRPGGALTDTDGWRDALAIFSVAMPILMLAASCLTVLANRTEIGWWGNPLGIATTLIIEGQLLLVPMVLLGLRRWAVAAAVGPLALTGYLVVLSLAEGFGGAAVGTYAMYGSWLLAAGVLEVLALIASPGPRRGLQLLRGRRWAYTAAAVLPAALVMAGPVVVLRFGGQSSFFSAAVTETFVMFCAIAGSVLGAAWLSSALGKRLAVLFAALASTYLAAVALSLPMGTPTSVLTEILALCSEVAVALVAVVAVRRIRHRSRP
jgi:hypothetical protein